MTRPALTSVRLHMGALYLAVATLLFTVGLGVFVDHRHDALNHQGEEVAPVSVVRRLMPAWAL
jgi:hypothetical protein